MLLNTSSLAIIFWLCDLGVLGIAAWILGSLLGTVVLSWAIPDLVVKNLEEPLSRTHIHKHFFKKETWILA